MRCSKYLADRKIGSAIYYPVPLHLQKCFAALGYEEGSLPVTEQACREVLSLPVYPELTAAEQGSVIDAIAELLQGEESRGSVKRVESGELKSQSQNQRLLALWLSTLGSRLFSLVLRPFDFVRAAAGGDA